MNWSNGLRLHAMIGIAACCVVVPCSAQPRSVTGLEHLVPCDPDDPEFGFDYINRVFDAFWNTDEPGPADDGSALVVVLPSFQPEWTLIIGTSTQPTAVEIRVASPQLWSANWVEVPGTNGRQRGWARQPAAVDVLRSIAEVRPETCRLLGDSIARLVEATQEDPQVHPGLDGTTYRFYSPTGGCGSCWTPHTSTRPGKAVALIEETRSFVTTGKPTEEELSRKLREFATKE